MILTYPRIETLCRAIIAPPANLGASGALSLGRKRLADLSEATLAYEARAQMHGAASSDFAIEILSGSVSSTTYAAYQRNTATVVGTASGSGTVRATITSAAVPGSPIIVNVAVTDGQTATTIAGLLRAAIAANAAISAAFKETGSGATIQLTRRIYAANDATLNIAISQPTGTGITPAATSTNTTAGVAGTEIISPAYPGSDAFGIELPTITEIVSCHISVTGGDAVMTDNEESTSLLIRDGGQITNPKYNISGQVLTFTRSAGTPLIEVLFFCK